MGAFKSRVTVEYIRGVRAGRFPAFNNRLLQRNYFEHIIRSEDSLNQIRQYIRDNPARWAWDRENAAAVTPEPIDAWRV